MNKVTKSGAEESLRQSLISIYEYGRRHDASESLHDRKMLNLDTETAKLIQILLRGFQAKRVLEIGTSNGYSTIWIAAAVKPNSGQVISIDHSIEKQRMARQNLEAVGLLDIVELRHGDASETIAQLEGPWDAVFFDADRVSAADQLRKLYPPLSKRALLLADNAISHPEELHAYLQMVQSLSEFQHTVVLSGKGLSVAFRG